MVLSLMRKQAKSWLIKVLIGIIAVVFIFYFGYSFTAKSGLKIAFVNGEVITGLEYKKAYLELLEAFRTQYKEVWNDNLIEVFDLKNRVLDNLINQKLISQEARRLGLMVTESESQKRILDYPAFQINGQFDMGRYRSILSRSRMEPEDFEETLTRELLEEKAKQFLSAFVDVTKQEVLDYYTFANEKIKLSFVHFKPDNFKKSIKLDESSMKGFFEEHKQDYRIPEKINITYLTIDPDTFRDQVEVTDLEIRNYYEYYIDTFKQPKEINARHILFRLSRKADQAEEKKVKKRAQAVLEKARQGKDFAALARKYSEAPTKAKGGDLGYFSAGRMVKPFDNAAFKLRKGEVSDLVRTNFGYHIIKVEDIKEARLKTLDEVRDQTVKSLITNDSTELAHEKGLSLIDQMPYDVDIAGYAAEHGLETKSTGYFSQNEFIPGIEKNRKLSQSLFSLERNETSELIELDGIFYIFQIADKKASYLPEIEEVDERIRGDFVNHLAAKEAVAAAESYLAELQKGKDWNDLARSRHLVPEETGFFTRRGPVPKIGKERELMEMIFGLNESKRCPDTVFENDKGAFVIRWEEKKKIDEKKYREEEKEKYRFSLIRLKNKLAFESLLENLKKNAEIKIVSPIAGE